MKGVKVLKVIYAVFLGLVQGLTEFLPVSSSGHLVAFQQIFNIEGASIAFDVALHLGTLVAVFAFYWRDIVSMVNEFFLWMGEILGLRKPIPFRQKDGHRTMMFMIIIASIPTAIIGFIFNDLFEKAFSSIGVVGFTLLITGVLLWITDKMIKGSKKANDISVGDAVTIGILQGLAITPGISRSGTTIFAGKLRGFNMELATKFSFLLSIPAILGAAILEGREVLKLGQGFEEGFPIFVGFIVAAVSGYFAIRFLVDLINKRKLYYFSYYCWTAGIIIVLYSLVLQ